MKEIDKLKACPFCGADSWFDSSGVKALRHITGCFIGAETDEDGDYCFENIELEKDAIRWNSRPLEAMTKEPTK